VTTSIVYCDHCTAPMTNEEAECSEKTSYCDVAMEIRLTLSLSVASYRHGRLFYLDYFVSVLFHLDRVTQPRQRAGTRHRGRQAHIHCV
jgi:hypothetical protein